MPNRQTERVFLCTDDPSVIAELGDYPHFDFVHLHFDRTVLSHIKCF